MHAQPACLLQTGVGNGCQHHLSACRCLGGLAGLAEAGVEGLNGGDVARSILGDLPPSYALQLHTNHD